MLCATGPSFSICRYRVFNVLAAISMFVHIGALYNPMSSLVAAQVYVRIAYLFCYLKSNSDVCGTGVWRPNEQFTSSSQPGLVQTGLTLMETESQV